MSARRIYTFSTLAALREQTPILDLSPDSIYILDLQGTIIFANKTACESRGYTEREITGKKFSMLLPPEKAILFPDRVRELLDKGELLFESAHMRKDNSIFPVETHVTLIQIGRRKYCYSIVRDISDRKKQEELFNAIVQTTQEGIWLVNSDLTFKYVNDAYCRMTGYRREEIMSMRIADIEVIEDVEKIQQHSRKIVEREYDVFTTKHRCMDGRIIDVSISVTHNKDDNFFVVLLRDVSEHRRMEEALLERETLLRKSQEIAHLGHWRLDPKTNIIDGSDELFKIFGLNRHNVSLESFIDAVHPADRDFAVQTLQDLITNGRNSDVEFRLLGKDGSHKFIKVIGEPALDKEGRTLSLYGTVQDITERKNAEEALQQNHHFLQRIIETYTGILYIHDLIENRNVYTNRDICNVLGYTVEQVQDMGSSLLQTILHPDDAGRVAEHHRLFATAGDDEVREIEYRMKHANGQWRWLHSRDTIFSRTPEGIPKQILGSAEDLTERRQAEETIRENEQKYRDLINGMNDTVWVIDFDTSILDVNTAATKVLGYMREELLSMKIPDIDVNLKPEEIQNLALGMQKDKTQVFETCHTSKNGKKISVEISSSLISYREKTAVMSIARDISERRIAEDTLRKSEERYRRLVESVTDYIYTVRIENGRPVSTTHGAACIAVTGYTSEEYDANSYLWYQMVHEEDRDAVLEQSQRIISGETVEPIEHRIIYKDGSIRWVRNTMVPVFDKDSRLVAYDGMVKNITERKRAEDALRRSEERYRLLFNIVREAVFVHYYTPNELPGKFIEVNDVACQRYGYTREEFLRMGPMDIDAPEGLALIPDAMQRLTAKGWAIWEGMHLSKDGRKIPVEITNVLFEDFGEPLILSTARDITERKQAEEDKQRLEEQLRQAQKMEAVGQLSGGIAHDFNNVLSIIMGSGHLLLMEMDTRNPQRELVDQIISSSKKAASLTQSLLAFSRKQVLRKFHADINGIIATVQKLLGRVIGEDITFQVETTHDSVVADVDSIHIEQVLMNLATNARDAMPHGGRLSISSKKVTWDEDSVREQGFGEPGVYCCIAVSDTGQGMDAETRERIFQPFFTTKEVGKGTGLGLAMVYGIVKQHAGYITVDSEVAKGSTFKLYLPLIKDLQGSPADEGIAISVPNAEEKTILLVEDDEMVRKVTTRMLTSNGYTVMQAVDGEEAIKQIQDNKDKIDLIILDVIMPRKSGKEVYDTIRSMGITTKVLFMSGYPADTITSKGVLQEGMYFLSKPAPPKTLFQMIRDILNA